MLAMQSSNVSTVENAYGPGPASPPPASSVLAYHTWSSNASETSYNAAARSRQRKALSAGVPVRVAARIVSDAARARAEPRVNSPLPCDYPSPT